MSGPNKGGDSSYADNTTPVSDPTLKQALDAARAKLQDQDGNPTPHYQAYLKYRDEYQGKVKALQKAHAAAFTDPMKLQNWPIDGVSYRDEEDEAMDRWVSLGFKEEIENAIATLAAQGTDPHDSGVSKDQDEG